MCLKAVVDGMTFPFFYLSDSQSPGEIASRQVQPLMSHRKHPDRLASGLSKNKH